jgi:hypothetical protein
MAVIEDDGFDIAGIALVIHDAKVGGLDVAVNKACIMESLETLKDLVEGFETELDWLGEKERLRKGEACEGGVY